MENSINSGNPWKGLSSYTYQDAYRFYGRDQELKDIVSVIKQNAFTTLYGISGAGKTSIINAGLFPLLDKQSFFPIYIRLDHNVGHAPYDLQIMKAVDNALLSIDAELENIVGNDVESELDRLWLYFHSHRFWSKDNHIIIPIIFIDQFEEIFTKNDDTDNIWFFFNIIDSLQYSTPTERILNAMENADNFVSFGEEQNFRMVFSMREDFLARFEDYSYNIPALRKNRIGLKPLNGLQALEVILKPRPEIVTRKVALHIISKVVGKTITDNERKLEATSVDTSILSLFCTELYNYAMSDNKGVISIPLVDLYGGNILEWFYDRNMQILPKQTYVYLENQLLTHSGFRNSVALENLLENDVLQDQLDFLAENRIIRIEDINHNLRVEFTHDVLCRIAKKRKDERDTIEKIKGEKAARRAFTIDNVLLFLAFTFALLAIYYVGIDGTILLTLCSMPLIAFLYMIIANRMVADKNLSKTIWFIIICCIVEVVFGVVISNLEDTLKSVLSEKFLFSVFCSCLSVIPLAIVLMPFVLLFKYEMKEKIHFLKNVKQSATLYAIFILGQSILLFLWAYYRSDDSYYIQYLVLFLTPSILFTMSPIYMLWKNYKNKTSKTLSGYTFAYTLYSVFVVLTIWAQSEYRIFPSRHSEGNIIALFVIWAVIGILCAFYAIQYMKQPKQQNFTEYYINVLCFQAFTKYKSFRPRLYTILICFAIFMMGVFATYYIDIVPFFTLPIASILALYVGRSEFKLTKKKTVFSLKCVVPIVLFAEIIVGCQYVIGWVKILAIYISALLIVALVLYYLLNHESLRNRKLFSLRVFAFALFIGFLLPLICIGYNIFNISLSSVSRVWNETISSDARNIYFMTIEDAEGNVGAMDYSEIIVEPKYKRIGLSCNINNVILKSVYPLRHLLMDILDVRYRGCGYSGIVDATYSPEMSKHDEAILAFYLEEKDGTKRKLNGLYFLGFKNKYGEAYVNNWLSDYNSIQVEKLLSPSNKCISEKDRNATIVKLFVRELAFVCKFADRFVGHGLGKIRIYDYDSDVLKLLIRCYNEASLEPLLKKDEKSPFTIEQLEQTALNVGYLFVSDKTGRLEKDILERFWNKLNTEKGKRNTTSNENRAYLFLLSGNKAKAVQIAKESMITNPNSFNASCNLCLSLYISEKISDMDKELVKFDEKNLDNLDSIVIYYNIISSKIAQMTEFGVLESDNELLSHISSLLKWDVYKIDMQKIKIEESGDALNTMAYEFARASKYNLAMICIDKAIRLYPQEANYYDSKGEILLMQGNLHDALEMWEKVISINPDFLDYYSSELHKQLSARGLLSN